MKAIVLALCVCIAALVYALVERDLIAEPAQMCYDSDTRERIRMISLDAFDAALKDHVEHLFDIWVKEPNTEQPKRARVGAQAGFSAYLRARQDALKWNPPECGVK